MNETIKTASFVSVAAAMFIAAGVSHFASQPKSGSDFELVGQPFFPEFESSEQVHSLEVDAIDNESLSLQRFSVKNEDGLWRIPSHHNYPAEAAARLAETATSVIGIERESLAGRLASEHEKLGVLDPLDLEIDDPESAGKRITLKDAEGEVVVDYIIGNEAGEVVRPGSAQAFEGAPAAEKYYYVRRPDEQQTYKVALNIDLSTRFADWIDPDLLRFDRPDLARIEIDNYTLGTDPNNRLGLIKDPGDQLLLTKSGSDPWQLGGLNPDKEELQTGPINQIIDVLSQMRIVGVRPKFKFKDHVLLTAELELNRRPEFEENPREFAQAIEQLQQDLDEKGFNLAGSQEKLELVSHHGQLDLGTSKGVLYALHVGKQVDGEETAIEIGSADSDAKNLDEKTLDARAAGSDGSGDDGASEKEDAEAEDAGEKNRYVMIRATFDETLLGKKPAKPNAPVEPVKPDGYVPAPAETPEGKQNEGAEDGAENAGDAADAPDAPDSQDTQEGEPKVDDTPQRDPKFVRYDEAVAEFEQRKVDHELAVSRFEDDLKAYEVKIEVGKKLVDELNERFGDWYYVVAASNLKTLQTPRDVLVTQIEIPGEPSVQTIPEDTRVPPIPDISFPEREPEGN